MNQALKSDDEVIALLELTMRDIARLAPEMSLDEYRHDYRWMATAAAGVIIVAGVTGVGFLASKWQETAPISPGTEATDSPPTLDPPSPTSLPPVDTIAVGESNSSPARPLATIPDPDAFPADVPRPNTSGPPLVMTSDHEPVGWEFLDRGGEPTESVARCVQYAALFDEQWISTAKTDEHASVIYARTLDNGEWRVGVYCTDRGDFLVQVMLSIPDHTG